MAINVPHCSPTSLLTYYPLFTIYYELTHYLAEGQEEEDKDTAPLENENDPESGPILSRGDRVRTPYGDGFVVRKRSAGEDDAEDDNAGFVYEVLLCVVCTCLDVQYVRSSVLICQSGSDMVVVRLKDVLCAAVANTMSSI